MIYENMSKEEMIKLLEQRNDLLREQQQIINDEKAFHSYFKGMFQQSHEIIKVLNGKLENKPNLYKRSSTIFWDVV